VVGAGGIPWSELSSAGEHLALLQERKDLSGKKEKAEKARRGWKEAGFG
jgi:hypothetical protein